VWNFTPWTVILEPLNFEPSGFSISAARTVARGNSRAAAWRGSWRTALRCTQGKPRPAPSRMRAPTKHLSLDGDVRASAAPPASLASVPAMSADAVQMMEFVGGEFEKSRFPPIETWTVAGLLHEVKLKYELQAVAY